VRWCIALSQRHWRCGKVIPNPRRKQGETIHETLNIEIMSTIDKPFWEDEDTVMEFAEKDPDHRLLGLLPKYEKPPRVRVLDLGCAGGRNTAVLAERGFDLFAVDSSSAMIRKTRERVAEIFGADKAAERVVVGHMEDLSAFSDNMFHLVLALGIYHNATDRVQWTRALSETARVLLPYGHLLVSNFSPRCDPAGTGLSAVEGEPNVYEGLGAGRHYFLEADQLDREMDRFGLIPAIPTETVVRNTKLGQRMTVNGLYVRTTG